MTFSEFKKRFPVSLNQQQLDALVQALTGKTPN